MKRIVGFAAVLTVAFVLIASPGYAIAGVTGTATNDTAILRVQVGPTVVSIGSDLAESLNTSTLKATAQFVTGTVGGTPLLGGGSRTATKASESGTEPIGTGTFSLTDLASVAITDGEIETLIGSNKVASAVDFVIGNVSAIGGFTSLGTTTSNTDSIVGLNSSTVQRTVQLGSLDVLNVGSLLGELGINPLALACTAIAGAGSQLGIDAVTGTACDAADDVLDLDAGTGAIPDALGTIDDTSGIVSTLSTLLAVPCALPIPGLSTACDAVTPQITQLTDTIAAINLDDPDTCVTVLGAVDQVTSQLGALDGLLAVVDGLVDIDALIAPITGQVAALDDARSALTTACNTLSGIVDGLLDTSLLSLDVANVAMNLVAKANPVATATGSIGALRVGEILVADSDDLQSISETLQGAIGDVTDALGGVLDTLNVDLPTPVLTLLTPVTDTGKLANGTYFADGSFSVAHLGLPSAVVNLPTTLPLDMLTGFAGFAPAAVRLAAVTTPAVSVDAGLFSGRATYRANATSGSTGGGNQLPVTGVGSAGLVISGLLTLAGAGVVRRITKFF